MSSGRVSCGWQGRPASERHGERRPLDSSSHWDRCFESASPQSTCKQESGACHASDKTDDAPPSQEAENSHRGSEAFARASSSCETPPLPAKGTPPNTKAGRFIGLWPIIGLGTGLIRFCTIRFLEGRPLERETIRALLVDDDGRIEADGQGDFVMTRALLDQIERPTIELDWVSTFEEGRAALERDDYDVFIVDYFLAAPPEDRTGLDLLREAGRRQLQAPVIMLTGRGSHDVDLDAMRAGAADYLIKGQIEPEDLERSIRYALARPGRVAAGVERERRTSPRDVRQPSDGRIPMHSEW